MGSPEKKKPAKNHLYTKWGKQFVRPVHLREHELRAYEGIYTIHYNFF